MQTDQQTLLWVFLGGKQTEIFTANNTIVHISTSN